MKISEYIAAVSEKLRKILESQDQEVMSSPPEVSNWSSQTAQLEQLLTSLQFSDKLYEAMSRIFIEECLLNTVSSSPKRISFLADSMNRMYSIFALNNPPRVAAAILTLIILDHPEFEVFLHATLSATITTFYATYILVTKEY